MTDADLILVGGGLANTLIALRLAESQPQLRVLILEQADAAGGNHTWSFHGSDLSDMQRQWIEPLVDYSWSGYEVRFPKRQRRLPGTYHSLTSDTFAEFARARLGESLRTGIRVAEVHPDRVTLGDGSVLIARSVIDGRGPGPNRHLDVRFQKFVGQVVELEADHGMTSPVIMDATFQQDDGYRFFYTLPFDARTLLIEDTRYSDGPAISEATYTDEIRRYAEAHNWRIRRVVRREAGVLPITLGGDIGAFWDASPEPVARSGLRAALFHPATGYSLPNALQLADTLAQESDWSAENIYRVTRGASEDLWNATGFYRIVNRLLFLAADPPERRVVLERFYGLRPGLIARFYAGDNSRLEKFRVLCGKPPVKISRALDALFRYSPANS